MQASLAITTLDRVCWKSPQNEPILGTVMDWDFRPLNPPMLGDFETDK